MINVFLVFWAAAAAIIVREEKIVRLIIYLGIFTMISAVCMLLTGAPDVAMAEAVISAFSTVIFIVCFEKYYSHTDLFPEEDKPPRRFFRKRAKKENRALPIIFTVFLAALFIFFIPDAPPREELKNQYLKLFRAELGGENAVTAVYLGYRMYDTLLEALMLLCSITAVLRLSWYEESAPALKKPSDIAGSDIAGVTIRIICPILLLFSAYLVMNGHITPGGGFHGGVVAAAFFICRYMIYDIYDMPIKRVITMEKLVYAAIFLVAAYFVILETGHLFRIPPDAYYIILNLLVGLKVACGFLIIFYRFIAFERN